VKMDWFERALIFGMFVFIGIIFFLILEVTR
jgi:hypothetical protein